MKKIKNMLETQSNIGYKRGCLMLDCNFKDRWQKILKNIDPNDVYSNDQGLEYEPHITILYGFLPEFVNFSNVIDVLSNSDTIKKISTIDFKTKDISSFTNDNFDVLKISIESTQLTKLHNELKSKLQNDYIFDKYNPHITIAYLKKGNAQKYIGNDNVDGFIDILSRTYGSFNFSYSEPAFYDIQLGNIGKKKHFFTINDIKQDYELMIEMSKSELTSVERNADDILDPIDVAFSKHFFDRVNDERNGVPISKNELLTFFTKLSKNKEQLQSFLDKYDQFVVKDKNSKLNVPFVNLVKKIIAKTIMRKNNFLSSSPEIIL